MALLALAAPAQARVAAHKHHGWRPVSTAACAGRFQRFTVTDEVDVPARYLAKVERAIIGQSAQVAQVWHSPCARFVASGGWPVYITWNSASWCDGAFSGDNGNPGCHGPSGGAVNGVPEGVPEADVAINGHMRAYAASDGYASWTVVLSHEIVESLVNPYRLRTNGSWTDPLEICDPVADSAYWLNGVLVSDWTLPAFWRGDEAARWDWMGAL